MPGMDGVETTKDLSKDQQHNQIVKDGMKEKLDLSGKLVVVTVTELGKSMLAGK
jgi:CheY-like chemotaxis protein